MSRADYDRIVMEIWTDGSLKPEEALAQAAQIMGQHLDPVAAISGESLLPVEPPARPGEVSWPDGRALQGAAAIAIRMGYMA